MAILISFLVLEAFLPRYFKGAEEQFELHPELLEVNHNNFKPKIPQLVRDVLARNMSKEIEFYHIVKQKLLKQYMSIQWIIYLFLFIYY